MQSSEYETRDAAIADGMIAMRGMTNYQLSLVLEGLDKEALAWRIRDLRMAVNTPREHDAVVDLLEFIAEGV